MNYWTGSCIYKPGIEKRDLNLEKYGDDILILGDQPRCEIYIYLSSGPRTQKQNSIRKSKPEESKTKLLQDVDGNSIAPFLLFLFCN